MRPLGRTSEAEPQHMIVDGSGDDGDRNIDFPEFLQLMARKQDEDYRLRGGDQGGLQIKVFDMDGSDLISGSELPTS